MALTTESLGNAGYYRTVRAREQRANLLRALRSPSPTPNTIRIEKASPEADVSADTLPPVGRTITLFEAQQSK